MPDVQIENPVINSPFEEPLRHFSFDADERSLPSYQFATENKGKVRLASDDDQSSKTKPSRESIRFASADERRRNPTPAFLTPSSL